MKNAILNYLADNIETSLYDTICRLQYEADRRNEVTEVKDRQTIVKNWVADCLDYLEIDLEKINKDNFNSEMHDQISEYADSNIEIYNYNIWQNAPILSEYIEEALEEYGGDMVKEGGLVKLFQYGEGRFYEALAWDIINKLEKYLDEQ